MFNTIVFNGIQFNTTPVIGGAVAFPGGSSFSTTGQVGATAGQLMLNGVSNMAAVGNEIAEEGDTFPGVSTLNVVGDVIASSGLLNWQDDSALTLAGVAVAIQFGFQGEGFLNESIYIFHWAEEGEPASTWNSITELNSNWSQIAAQADQWKKVIL